jgi:hypothetical protein
MNNLTTVYLPTTTSDDVKFEEVAVPLADIAGGCARHPGHANWPPTASDSFYGFGAPPPPPIVDKIATP